MKLVIISTIRNEADILEAFVRYHLQFADRMIIVNHRSADSSGEILQDLQKEGLPLEIIEERSLDHQQGPLLTRIMNIAVHDYGADWVVPLDADEFIAASETGPVREILEKLPQDRVVKVPWRTYVPLPSDDAQEPNILKRIRHYRRAENNNLRKIMIPRCLAVKKNGRIAAGNHGFVKQAFRKQKDFPYVDLDHLVLAHFPVRSGSQIMTKALVGWLACLSKPNKEPTENYHLKLLFDRLKHGDDLGAEEISKLAMGYATESVTKAVALEDIVFKPLVPDAGHFSLRHTDTLAVNPLPVLAQMAEEFAEALGAVQREHYGKMAGFPGRLKRWLRFWEINHG